MRKSDIIKRITEIVDAKSDNGILDLLLLPGGINRSILVSDDGQHYYVYKVGKIKLDDLHKHLLSSILFEIGNDHDRSSVKESMSLDAYLWLSDKLGLVGSHQRR